MSPHELLAAAAVAREAAERAGTLIRSRWGSALRVEMKGAVDLVSDVDFAAEALLVGRLASAFPDDRIVAEESGANAEPAAGRRTWYVDPLDGTTNFAHGFPQFCVSVALVDAVGLAVGVVHDPLRDWTFHAIRGGGAWLGGKRLRVSETARLDAALVATGFPYDRRTNPDNNVSEFAHVLHHVQCVRRAGSAALDLAFVAAGWLDGYWEDRLQPWDLAAGALLVDEAGGRVSAPDGAPFDPRDGRAVATNGHLHAELLHHLRTAPRLGPASPSGDQP